MLFFALLFCMRQALITSYTRANAGYLSPANFFSIWHSTLYSLNVIIVLFAPDVAVKTCAHMHAIEHC